MIGQLARAGWRGAAASAKLAPQLLSNQGVPVQQVSCAVCGRSGARAGTRPSDSWSPCAGRTRRGVGPARPRCHSRTACGHPPLVDDFANALRELRWNKMIVAGRTVTASVRAASWEGVALIEFTPRSHEISRVRMYVEQVGPFPK